MSKSLPEVTVRRRNTLKEAVLKLKRNNSDFKQRTKEKFTEIKTNIPHSIRPNWWHAKFINVEKSPFSVQTNFKNKTKNKTSYWAR